MVIRLATFVLDVLAIFSAVSAGYAFSQEALWPIVLFCVAVGTSGAAHDILVDHAGWSRAFEQMRKAIKSA